MPVPLIWSVQVEILLRSWASMFSVSNRILVDDSFNLNQRYG